MGIGDSAARLFCVALGALALVTCGAPNAAPQESSASEIFERARADAAAEGVDESQISALADAAERGAMSYDQVEVLLDATFACFDDNGLSHQTLGLDESVPGFPYPQFGVGVDPRTSNLTDEQGERLAAECQQKYLDFALAAYGSQPAVQEAQDAQMVANLSSIRECLEAHGIALEADPSLDEIRHAVMGLYFEGGDGEAEGVLCYDKLG